MITALAVCHILPETVSSYDIAYAIHEAEHAKEHAHRLRLLAAATGVDVEHGGKFPTPYVLFLIGFWVMQLLDQVIFKKIDQ